MAFFCNDLTGRNIDIKDISRRICGRWKKRRCNNGDRGVRDGEKARSWYARWVHIHDPHSDPRQGPASTLPPASQPWPEGFPPTPSGPRGLGPGQSDFKTSPRDADRRSKPQPPGAVERRPAPPPSPGTPSPADLRLSGSSCSFFFGGVALT